SRQPDGQDGRGRPRRRLGWREVTEGPQTPRVGGYIGIVVGRGGLGRGCIGPGWRAGGAGGVSRAVPRLATALGRQPLWRGLGHRDAGPVWDRYHRRPAGG